MYEPEKARVWVALAAQGEAAIEQALRAATVDLENIFARVPAPPPHEPYARALLGASEAGEALAARWQKGGRALPHDHGAASGFVWLARGVFEEEAYAHDATGLRLLGTRTLEAPRLLVVARGSVHAMTALTEGATSLHVYLPRISTMRVYDEARRRVLHVAEGAGAWIPHDRALILAEEPLAPQPASPREVPACAT